MTILQRSGYRRMAWKNGGGETAEIAVFPPAAGLDGFDWRLSMADVRTDGPFSVFAGIDRTLTILSGDGIVLDFDDGAERLRLSPETEPQAFSGDRRVESSLIAGPVVDLNLMTRRGVCAHRVRRVRSRGPLQLAASSETVCVFAILPVELDAGAGRSRLDRFDCAIFDGPLELSLTGAGDIHLIVAEIDRISSVKGTGCHCHPKQQQSG